MRLAAELRQLLLIDLIDRHVMREQPRAILGRAILGDLPRGEPLAVNAGAGIGADRGEQIEKRLVALPVLLGQVTDRGCKIAPGRGGMGELRAERVLAVAERQHRGLRLAADDRRQLEEIADQHHLQPAERRGHAPDVAADRVHQGQAARRQHRDLVDHQHLRPLDAGGEPAIGGERIEIAGVERLAHADAAPGMDGHAVAVRGGDAGRGGIGELDALPLQPLDVAVDRMRLAAAGLAGEKHRRAGLEQSERFVLCHAAMPSGRGPSRKPKRPWRATPRFGRLDILCKI